MQRKRAVSTANPSLAPRRIRDLYRRRCVIESNYRQMRQAYIDTYTKRPVLRLHFVQVRLVLRNIGVWLHWTYLADRQGNKRIVRLERLNFCRMLDWIAKVISAILHDGAINEIQKLSTTSANDRMPQNR